MGFCFWIKNSESDSVLTLKQLSDLDKKIAIHNIDEERLDELWNNPLNQVGELLLVEYGKSARGFFLQYDEEEMAYIIELSIPSPRIDWKIALRFIKKLAKHLNAVIYDEIDEVHRPESMKFEYDPHILPGINFMQEGISIHGFRLPIVFTQEMLDKIRSSSDPIDTFEKVVIDIQYTDAYPAKADLLEDKVTGGIRGRYDFLAGVRTILPDVEHLEYDNSDVIHHYNLNVEKWSINLVQHYTEEDKFNLLAEMDYSEFLQLLPKDKYRYLDGAYLLIEEISNNELATLLKKNKRKSFFDFLKF